MCNLVRAVANFSVRALFAHWSYLMDVPNFNISPLKTKRRLLYLKTQSIPRSKHFSSRL